MPRAALRRFLTAGGAQPVPAPARRCLRNTLEDGCLECGQDGRCTRCVNPGEPLPAAAQWVTQGDWAVFLRSYSLDAATGRCVQCASSACARCDVANPSRCLECASLVREAIWGEMPPGGIPWQGGFPEGPTYNVTRTPAGDCIQW